MRPVSDLSGKLLSKRHRKVCKLGRDFASLPPDSVTPTRRPRASTFPAMRAASAVAPLGSTTSVSIFLYKEGFRMNQFGYASAGSIVLFAIIAVITVVQLRARKADDEY